MVKLVPSIRRYAFAPVVGLPDDAFCSNCEHYDHGDCLSPLSDRFTPETDHVCASWFRDTGDSNDLR